jgi:hypothetical protein
MDIVLTQSGVTGPEVHNVFHTRDVRVVSMLHRSSVRLWSSWRALSRDAHRSRFGLFRSLALALGGEEVVYSLYLPTKVS